MKHFQRKSARSAFVWRSGFYVLCLWLLVGQWACNDVPGSSSCYPCTPGENLCTPDKKFVRTCEQVPGTQCYSITLRPCSGGACAMTQSGPQCQAPCQNVCQQGQFSCSAKVLLACQPNTANGCMEFTELKVCSDNETCDPTSGICIGECIPTNEQLGTRCDSGGVYWFDNCGNRRALVKQCPAGEQCEKADCVKPTCTPKDPYAKKKCEGNSVYYFDDCDNKGEKQLDCPSHLKCINGECANCTATNPKAEKRCEGNAVYYFDNCGTKGEKVEDCAAETTCEMGVCKGKCTDACTSEGSKQCDQSNGIQTCAKGADGCLAWGPAEPCPAGKKCELGVCNEGQACPDECPTLNDTKCEGTKIRTCVADSALKCNRWSAAQDCSNSQTCQDGKCGGGGCNNNCSPGQKQCIGNSKQDCVADANGCYDWGPASPCPAGQACNQGVCSGGSAGGPQAGETGSSCTSGSQCTLSGGGCITNWPTGYCTKLCSSSACPSDAICGRVGNNPPFCLRKCTSPSDCNSGYKCTQGACLP